MIDLFGFEMRVALAFGLSVALKATLLMLAALAVHLLLGRRRPLVRSVIWNACLLGLLLLPVSAASFPKLRFHAPRGPASAPAVARPVASNEPAHAVGQPSPIPHAPVPILPANPSSRIDWAAAVLLAYVAIASGLVARLGLSLLAVGRLRRSSLAVQERRWVEALDRWRGRLGLSRTVRLARSRRLNVPVIVGWLRPVILLPDALVETAAPATIDAVLLHELAHVRRGDYAWNVLLRLVQAAYWPHPLVWLIGRIIAGVREQACDDLCISWLGGASGYRASLLDVAAGLIRRPWETLGLAMTRSTKLGCRLAQIDQSLGSSRCLLRAPARGAIVAAVLAAFALLGSITLARPRADEPRPLGQAPALRAQDERAKRDDVRRPVTLVQREADEPKPQDQKTQARRVRVERVKRGDVRRTTTQSGSLQAFESADLFSKLTGYLKQQNVDIGDRVKEGELLAVIDAPEAMKEVERAEAAVKQAKVAVAQAKVRVQTAQREGRADEAVVSQAQAEVERSSTSRKRREAELARYKTLFDKHAVPQQIVDEELQHLDAAKAVEHSTEAALTKAKADVSSAQSRVDQAKADLEQAEVSVQLARANMERAQIMVNYTRIISPYDGVITQRGFHRGAFIRTPDAGTNVPLFTVTRTDKMRVITHIPDRDVPYLDRDDPAEIRLDALPGQTFRGKVARFSETEAPTRTMRTEIDLDNSGHQFREGMHGIVTIVLGNQAGLTIPATAISGVGGDGSYFCYRIVDGRAVLTPIKVGFGDDKRIVVLEGLKEGDTVAVDPRADHVEQGQAVEVEER